MKKNWVSLVLGFLFALNVSGQAGDTVVSTASPDKKLVFFLRWQNHSTLTYKLVYGQKEIVNWSPLGLELSGQTQLPANGMEISKLTQSVTDETFPWLFGENASIHNHYRQLAVQFSQTKGQGFGMVVRVFNNNVAFRYVLSGTTAPAITKEFTGFYLPDGFTAWRHNIESVISPVPLNALKTASDFPLVLHSPELAISINEAQNNNYTKAVIGRGVAANGLEIKFNKDTVKTEPVFSCPWRTLSVSETALGLCKYSDLLYKLSDKPSPGRDYSWIKPGKLIRDMSLSTAGATDCIDFAANMHFQYIMFDAGWYGKGYAAEFDKDSDPVKVVSAIDMPGVTRYAKEKGIGLILYVNYVGLRKNNLDTLFTLYKSWGVRGLKFGFVNGLTQDGIQWLMKAVAKAQDYGFIINVHDNYKPTGLSRTMPAFLTQEGVRGNENNPDAFHNTTLPFTRFLSGPADYTFCYRSQNDSFNTALLSKKLQVSQAQQLALTVIYYSPLQSMLWYGRPKYYQKPEELAFFKDVPTVWDKTVYLAGEIGQYITVARKKANVWYMGTAVNEHDYKAAVSLDFLDKGKTYQAFVYSDDGRGGILKTVLKVNKDTKLDVAVSAKGGQAVMISEYVKGK